MARYYTREGHDEALPVERSLERPAIGLNHPSPARLRLATSPHWGEALTSAAIERIRRALSPAVRGSDRASWPMH